MKNQQQSQSSQTKRIFQIPSSLGQLHLQLNIFPHYIFLIVTQSSQLKVNGTFQLSMKTPYETKPTVVNLSSQEGQADSDYLISKLTGQFGISFVVSYNLDCELNKKVEYEVFEGVCKVLKTILPKKQQKQQ